APHLLRRLELRVLVEEALQVLAGVLPVAARRLGEAERVQRVAVTRKAAERLARLALGARRVRQLAEHVREGDARAEVIGRDADRRLVGVARRLLLPELVERAAEEEVRVRVVRVAHEHLLQLAQRVLPPGLLEEAGGLL